MEWMIPVGLVLAWSGLTYLLVLWSDKRWERRRSYDD